MLKYLGKAGCSMFFIRMKKHNRVRKKRSPTIKDSPVPLVDTCSSVTDSVTSKQNVQQDNIFIFHMARYIGKTVTIFVAAGGSAGSGFTGVLLDTNPIYIKLLTRIGPPPACSLNNTYMGKLHFNYTKLFSSCNYNRFLWPFNTLGSITYIPSDKVVSFVHNSL